MRILGKLGLLGLMIGLLVGCTAVTELLPAADGTDAGRNDTESGDNEPELEYEGPPPPSGLGSVYGQVMWNSTDAPNLDLLLCADFSPFSGCSGEEYTTQTDEEGFFLFEDVSPGTYALSVRIFNTDEWLYMSGGLFSSADFEVEAGETLVIGVQNIYKLDLDATYPPPAGNIDTIQFTLDWEPYPDAAYYKIYLTPSEGQAVLVDQRANESGYDVQLLPVNCEYRWQLEAFNEDRIKIAESADFFTFQVTGQEADCLLELTAPLDGETIPGDAVVLDWEPNELAVSYDILMWNDDSESDENVLDFVEVSESQYVIGMTLEPGRHVWSVRGFDEEGEQVAGSDIFDFLVEE